MLLGFALVDTVGCTVDDVVASRIAASEADTGALVPDVLVPPPLPTEPPDASLQLDASPKADASMVPSNDAQAADASVEAVCPASALYCSGFEEPLDEDQIVSDRGEVIRDELFARSGERGLRISVEGFGARAMLAIPVANTQDGSVFVRMYLLVPSEVQLMDLVAAHIGEPQGREGVNLDLWANDRFELYLPASDRSAFSGDGAVPRDDWMCLVIELEVDDELGGVSLRRDGTLVAQADNVDTLPPGGISRLSLGVTWSQSQQPPATLYMDDVVVDREPIDCL